MNIIAKQGDIIEERADLLVFCVFAGTQNFSGALRSANKALNGLIADAAAEERFGGKLGDQLSIHTHGKLPANRILLIGLGGKKPFNAEAIRRAAGTAARYADKIEATKIVFQFIDVGLDRSQAAQALVEGAFLAESITPRQAAGYEIRGGAIERLPVSYLVL
jgi:leucyl aminopeptidase